MAGIDVEKLLEEISPDQPAGEDLEYDPAFGELERSAQGKPEQQFGDTIIPAEDPDWKAVKKNAVALFPRTKDLRVAIYLAQALLHTDGISGFSDGLEVVHGLVTRMWDTVHPELDPDDDNDPTMRVNCIATLCDAQAVLHAVREAPLVKARAFGSFSLRDIQVASGQMALPEGQDPPDTASLDAAFLEADIGELQGTAASIGSALEKARQLEDEVTAQVGASQAPNLESLREVLREAQQAMNERLARRGIGSAEVGGEAGGEAVAAAGGRAVGAAAQRIAGEITCREDVIRMLDKACEYFARNEPTSPVPLLLERAKRFIGMNFLDILKELAPDGVQQVQTVAGITE